MGNRLVLAEERRQRAAAEIHAQRLAERLEAAEHRAALAETAARRAWHVASALVHGAPSPRRDATRHDEKRHD